MRTGKWCDCVLMRMPWSGLYSALHYVSCVDVWFSPPSYRTSNRNKIGLLSRLLGFSMDAVESSFVST